MRQITELPPIYDYRQNTYKKNLHHHLWIQSALQILRFGLVGGLNTVIDLLILNSFIWLWPTRNTAVLLIYNSIAYAIGGINSFLLNRYWTFRRRQRITAGEVSRFILITVLGIACNDALIWLTGTLLHPLIADTRLWANTSKIIAIAGTALISYLSMRLWVFVSPAHAMSKSGQQDELKGDTTAKITRRPVVPPEAFDADSTQETFLIPLCHGLSVILPAYNEEQVIEQTVISVLTFLQSTVQDYDVIVVNDGSSDGTGAIVEKLAATQPRLHLISHQVNRGYGAALVSGFQAVDKELAFFMDSDGQFDIHDLARFFPYIDQYDAVLGYRIHRQDSWLRRLNAWGWKMLVRLVLGVRVRDVDCAFKLYKSSFLRRHQLQTSGAMINAEMLYKLQRAGGTFTEVGVRHLPRRSGQASGAHPKVIMRALKELFAYGLAWKREERLRGRK